MSDFFAILRSNDSVQDHQAIEAFRILGPLLRAAPNDEEALAFSSNVVERMDADSVVAGILDWWLFAMTEADAGWRAYQLPEAIPIELRAAMEGIRDATTGGAPAGRWAIGRRILESEVSQLGQRRMPETWQPRPSIANEHAVRQMVLEQQDDILKALRLNEECPGVTLDDSYLETIMTQCAIDRNSPIWGQTLKRERQFLRWLNNMVGLNHMVQPWIKREEPPSIAAIPKSMTQLLGDLDVFLLEPLLAVEERPDDAAVGAWFDTVDVHLEKQLSNLVSDASIDDQYLLFHLTDDWVAATGSDVTVFRAANHEASRLQRLIDQETERGTDVSGVDRALKAYEFSRAQALMADIQKQNDERRRLEQVRRALDESDVAIRYIAEDSNTYDSILDLRTAVLDQLDAGNSREAKALLDKMNSDISRATESIYSEQVEIELAQLEKLDEQSSDLVQLRDQFQAAVDSGESLVKLHTEIKQHVAEVAERMREELDDALEHLRDLESDLTDENADDALIYLQDQLAEIDEFRKGGEASRALQLAIDLIQEVERQRITTWTEHEGEDALVEHLIAYCNRQHTFQESDIRRFHVALKTKPFVILSGLTGSGKSTIARLYAEALGATESNRRYRRIAVRPDWIDQTDVLGYVSPRTQLFEPGWLAEVIQDCLIDPDRLHFVVLDEMNLAPVEYYFAEYLSVLEESRSSVSAPSIRLYSRSANVENGADWPSELPLPSNLIVIGTINLDETTRALSARVLDRANVLQLSMTVTSDHHEPKMRDVAAKELTTRNWRTICKQVPDDRHHDFLVDVADILQRAGIGVGQRAHIELERFIANADGVMSDEDALDLGVLQRIIPKVRGFSFELKESLEALLMELESAGCVRSAAVVHYWLRPNRSDNQFIDGTDPKLGLLVQ